MQHQHNQYKCQSITKRDDLKLELNILTYCLVVKSLFGYMHSKLKFIPNFQIHDIYPEYNEQ